MKNPIYDGLKEAGFTDDQINIAAESHLDHIFGTNEVEKELRNRRLQKAIIEILFKKETK